MKVNEKTRSSMWRLRDTWDSYINLKVLHNLDLEISKIDKAWPVKQLPKDIISIHVNPHFKKVTILNVLIKTCEFIQIYIGRQHRKDIDLYLKPFRGNNNIINLNTSYEKNVQLSSNKYLLLLLLLIILLKDY